MKTLAFLILAISVSGCVVAPPHTNERERQVEKTFEDEDGHDHGTNDHDGGRFYNRNN